MAVRTTKVDLKGDRYQAEQLALAHVNRLLYNFRTNNSFRDLQVSSQRVNFFDNTGTYVGEVYLQTVHGAENIIVTCPSGKKVEKREMWHQRSMRTTKIVPVMRDETNTYWVACLSGTFDGPYYLFKNVYEITEEQLEDNVEQGLNNKLVSIGETPLGASANFPQLFFVSQTGNKPAPEDIVVTDTVSTDTRTVTVTSRTYVGQTGMSLEFEVYYDRLQGKVAQTGEWYSTVWGHPESIPVNFDNTTTTTDTEWQWSTEDGPLSDEMFWVLLQDLYVFQKVEVAAEGIYSLWNTADPLVNDMISMEPGASGNFALCYRSHTHTRTSTTTPGDIEYITETTTVDVYCDFFKVGATEFALHEGNDSVYPTFTGLCLRYYNTDSLAKVTGLASALVRIDPHYEHRYYYVGPTTSNALATTAFPSIFMSYHTIPDVDGIDDTVHFKGKFFLGLVDFGEEITKFQVY